jgi:hypothetical protein
MNVYPTTPPQETQNLLIQKLPDKQLLHVKMPPRPQLGVTEINTLSLGQSTDVVADTRASAATALVGLGLALYGSMGNKEPIMIIVGSIMAGIGGAGLVSGLVKNA